MQTNDNSASATCNGVSQGPAATMSREGRPRAASSSEGKAREASAAFSELGGAELPRATFRPSRGTIGGFWQGGACSNVSKIFSVPPDIV